VPLHRPSPSITVAALAPAIAPRPDADSDHRVQGLSPGIPFSVEPVPEAVLKES
jgi:hypothetical protein